MHRIKMQIREYGNQILVRYSHPDSNMMNAQDRAEIRRLASTAVREGDTITVPGHDDVRAVLAEVDPQLGERFECVVRRPEADNAPYWTPESRLKTPPYSVSDEENAAFVLATMVVAKRNGTRVPGITEIFDIVVENNRIKQGDKNMEKTTIEISPVEIGRNQVHENYMVLEQFAKKHFWTLYEGAARLSTGVERTTASKVVPAERFTASKLTINKTVISSNGIVMCGGWNTDHEAAYLTDDHLRAAVSDIQVLLEAAKKEIVSQIEIRIVEK